ncbi:UNVERIFIED_CONTAM: hypothetical protein FKN15_048731 [Acipenser sinensis]
MSLKGGLFGCADPAVWREVQQKYWDVVELKSSVKGKNQGKLLPLEKWYQEELPESIAARSERFLEHQELVKLMEWKLTRGKFRPRLQQLVAANPNERVETCTRRAFGLLPDVQAAIAELSTLKALGPATASDRAAFMADEAVQSIPGLTPIQYTMKHYAVYLQEITERARTLNQADSSQEWTPHLVERCLWTWAVAEKLQPSLLEGIAAGEKGGGESERSGRAAKRQKTK